MCQSNGWVTPVRPWVSVAANAREKVSEAAAVPTMWQDPALSKRIPGGQEPANREHV